ncbi:MAG: FIST C-terminal domain-containing protein [Alphaproteobacteria bacterium]|nr:FIST C-terminal domain-containing protein [Alphaproteobacteria bacterium]
MQIAQQRFDSVPTSDALRPLGEMRPDLVLVFGSVAHFAAPGFSDGLRQSFPDSSVVGCSTAGEITRRGVDNGSCVVTAIRFAGTPVRVAEAPLTGIEGSFASGEDLARRLAGPGLAGALVFGRGLGINGSALIDGMASVLGADLPISGGLAGDDGAFQRTLILTPSGVFDDRVVAIGFFGGRLRLGHGSFGGWEPFGPTRRVTRAEGNILFELDGEPALNIYKRYLGEYAKDLPASGLLFPFEMLDEGHARVGLIRTILGIDEAAGSLILAGAIDPSGYLRLMHASPDALVQGAEQAARTAAPGDRGDAPALAVLVSCVGRKLVMGDQVDDEIDAVVEHLGEAVTVAGFYSYGEICPTRGGSDCRLHNQTMTVTLLAED